MTPFFSIVIPTYNRGSLIKETLSTVLSQSFKDFEIIVVDDGSTDETQSILNKIAQDKLHYYYKKNGERGAARNYGVQKAKGKYVFFLDSDDGLTHKYLEHAYDQLNNLNQPEFFHIRYITIDTTTNKKYFAETLNQQKIAQNIQYHNKIGCQFFLRRDIALQFPFSENRSLKIGEDWDVVLKISARYPLNISNQHLGIVNQHEGRSMVIAKEDTIIASRDLLISQIKEDKGFINKYAKTPINIFSELTTLAALSCSMNNQPKKAIKHLIKGTKNNLYYLFQKRTLAIFKHMVFSK